MTLFRIAVYGTINQRGAAWIAVSFTIARSHLKVFCDGVIDSDEAVIVTRKAAGNMVIISKERYRALERLEQSPDAVMKMD